MFRAPLRLFVADEVALQTVLNNKGSSESVPCMQCHNIYNGPKDADIPAHTGVKHLFEALPVDFEEAANESIWAIIDHLEAQRPPTSTAAQFDLL